MAAAEQMTPEQRQAFIESMVERLAAKMKEEPENLDGWIRLANAYGVLEKREEARAAWAEAAKRAPSRLDVQLDYAGALIQGRTDLAKTVPAELPEAVKRIRTLDPANPLGLFYAGVVARAEGRPDEAKALWEKVLALMPEGSPSASSCSARSIRSSRRIERQPQPRMTTLHPPVGLRGLSRIDQPPLVLLRRLDQVRSDRYGWCGRITALTGA